MKILVIYRPDTGYITETVGVPDDHEPQPVPAGKAMLVVPNKTLRELFPDKKTPADFIVKDGVVIPRPLSLEEAKQAAYASIDTRTDDLIAHGFQFQNRRFSLSMGAQQDMLGMDHFRNEVPYPITWNCLDDTDTIHIVDAAGMHNFAMAGLAYLRSALDGGTTLKAQVRAATTVEAIQAITDTR